jgi:hypothetical protein
MPERKQSVVSQRQQLREERIFGAAKVPMYDWGVVQIAKPGPWFGRIGYYDDDEGRGLVIVYLSDPLDAPGYLVIRRSELRRASRDAERRWMRVNMSGRLRRRMRFGHLRVIDGGVPRKKPPTKGSAERTE